MWKELIRRFEPAARFRDPVTPAELVAAEARLGSPLPAELRDCLLETNGVETEYAVLLWGVGRIADDNHLFRTNPEFRDLYMAFDQLLFFADAGNGDQFGYRMLPGAGLDTEIYVWNHEDDSRTWAASGLARFLESWLTGMLKV
ncbi:MAG: SMI1/KNR4 family protein [Gemmataceae bacterium]|nr:SMI1/KNR4 family protein [Gemmataceae bacterium]